MTEELSVGGAKLIFVGGIHGVGKSSLCSWLCEKLGSEHLVAGDLLKAAKQQSQGPDKRVFDVERNQDVLVESLARNVRPGGKYFLDGHFVLVNGKSEIEEIQIRTFQAISPIAVVLVTEDPYLIAGRLGLRDGRTYQAGFLEALQNRESAHAKAVCRALQKTLLHARQGSGSDRDEILESVRRFLK